MFRPCSYSGLGDELLGFLDASALIVLAVSCSAIWMRASCNIESASARSLKVQHFIACIPSGDSFKLLFQKLDMPSLISLRLVGEPRHIHEVVDHITAGAPRLTNLRFLQLASRSGSYSVWCDGWVKKLAACMSDSFQKLRHLSLPQVYLTPSGSKLLGAALASATGLESIDMHFAQMSNRAWDMLFVSFSDRLQKLSQATLGLSSRPHLTIKIAPEEIDGSNHIAVMPERIVVATSEAPSVPVSTASFIRQLQAKKDEAIRTEKLMMQSEDVSVGDVSVGNPAIATSNMASEEKKVLENPDESAGCSRCLGIGCAHCNRHHAVIKNDRRTLEKACLSPLENIPALRDCDTWSYRYYDSLDRLSDRSATRWRAAGAQQAKRLRLADEQRLQNRVEEVASSLTARQGASGSTRLAELKQRVAARLAQQKQSKTEEQLAATATEEIAQQIKVGAEANLVIKQPGSRKRGRPPLTEEQLVIREQTRMKVRSQKGRLAPEDRRRMQEPSAAARLHILKELDKMAPMYESRLKFWADAEAKFGLPVQVLKRYAKPEARRKTEAFMQTHQAQEQRGAQRTWKMFQSKDTGCRVGKDGKKKKTFQSPFKEEIEELRGWASRQKEMGHDLCDEDLVVAFHLILMTVECELEEEKANNFNYLPDVKMVKLQKYKRLCERYTTTHVQKYWKAKLSHECRLTFERDATASGPLAPVSVTPPLSSPSLDTSVRRNDPGGQHGASFL